MTDPDQWPKFRALLFAGFSLLGGLSPTGARAETLEPSTLSPLAPKPDWRSLDRFQGTITRTQFETLLHTVFAPADPAAAQVAIDADEARITTGDPAAPFTLRFAAEGASRGPTRPWRAPRELPPAPGSMPLKGVRIALDPGHIGGDWARMEERWFQIGDAAPVMEGEMTLRTARHLASRLEALGAEVSLVRSRLAPVSRSAPARLETVAARLLAEQGTPSPRRRYDGPNDPERQKTVQWQSELLFYRTSEIRQRARIINERLKPDLTVCLHFNAEPWGDPAAPELVNLNHLHLLVNGNYGPSELRFEDIRFDMFRRLLGGAWPEELALSEAVAAQLASATGLPPYVYKGDNARLVGSTGYVWIRNLLANRLFDGPVLYLEPYVMNSHEVFARVQAGDYEGRREFGGVPRESIYREYAGAVAEGIAAHFRANRRMKP